MPNVKVSYIKKKGLRHFQKKWHELMLNVDSIADCPTYSVESPVGCQS